MSAAADAAGRSGRRRGLRWWWGPVGFVASYALPFLISVAIVLAVGAHHAPLWVGLALTTLLQLCMVAITRLFAGRADRSHPWRTLMLRPTNARHAVGWALLGWVTTIILAAIYVSAVGPHAIHPVHRHHAPGLVAGWIVSAVLFAPIAEELFYRGLFFGALRRRLPIGWATAITATVFGLAHWIGGDPLITVPPRVIFGIVACLLVVRTGSLIPGMALHAWNNGVATAPSVTGLIVVASAGVLVATVALIAPWRIVIRRRERRGATTEDLPRSGEGIEPSKRGAATPCRF